MINSQEKRISRAAQAKGYGLRKLARVFTMGVSAS